MERLLRGTTCLGWNISIRSGFEGRTIRCADSPVHMGVQTRAQNSARRSGDETPVTPLKAFCASRNIAAANLAREACLSRQHVMRIMGARLNTRQNAIAAITSALRRMTLEPVRADELFTLTAEEEAAFRAERKRVFDLQKRASIRARSFVEALSDVQEEKRLKTVLAVRRTAGAYGISTALILEARRLTAKSAMQAATYAEYAAALLRVSPSTALSQHLEGCAALALAVALRHRGEFPRALLALTKAEAAFVDRPHSSSELAQTWYVRGIIEMKQGRFLDAERDARAARTVFQLLGDTRRDAYTRLLEGGVAFEQGDAHRARDLFRSTLAPLYRAEEEKTLALAWMNLGSAEARLGNVAAAKDWISRAEAVFSHRAIPEELARAHWAYGYALATHDNAHDGIPLMRRAAQEFDDAKLPVDAAFVRLDLTEALLAKGDRAAAVTTCEGIVQVLAQVGANAAARQAVEYLCRALADGEATVSLARYVKTYTLAAHRGTVAPFEPRVAA